METKRDLDTKAKALVKTSPEEAVKIYAEIWENHSGEFNSWDAFYTLQSLRGSKSPSLKWAREVIEKFPEEINSNIYGWLIFDHCVKKRERNELLAFEPYISGLSNFCPQKDMSIEAKFPCPTTISVFKLCETHAENQFNATKINSLLEALDSRKLSAVPKSFTKDDGKEVEPSSDLEKYFSLKTKALIKLEKYQECKDLAEIALQRLEKFHTDNDLWFKMRIALCEEGMGNHEASEQQLSDLLSSRAGSNKWFLYRDISEVYFEQGDFTKAWKYAVDSTFYGNEPGFMIKLYLHQAKVLYKLNRAPEGKLMAELISAILKEEGWKEKQEYSKLFSYYKIDTGQIKSLKEVLADAKVFWEKERYGIYSKISGEIIKIHTNKKSGLIKTASGARVNFGRNDFVKKVRDLESLVGAQVNFFLMKSFDEKDIAEQIDITQMPAQSTKPSVEVSQEPFNGIVKSVASFGVFIKVPGQRDGLLHVSKIPDHLKEKMEDFFTTGKSIQVKIQKVTEKGIELQLVEKL
jgi:hypothetical protein